MYSDRRRSRDVERMIKICWYGPLRVISLALILTCAFFPAPLYAAEDGSSEVHIDADSVVYQENTGIATADGNVKVRSKTLSSLPRMSNTTATTSCGSFSDEREKVDLSPVGQTDGKSSDLQPRDEKGVLTDASGKMEALYMQGNDVRVMPMEDAVSSGSLSHGLKEKDRRRG